MGPYLEYLESSARERQSIVCFGLDPVSEMLPQSSLGLEEGIFRFFSDIIDSSLQESKSISAIKPNYAYFAQYGWDGLRALKKLMEKYSGKLPIIFDGKRGDILKSSEAYAKEAFAFWGADALTVSPYMGQDSVMPFISFCKEGKGVYVLCRTSNPGASDFQSLATESGKRLFLEVAEKAAKWHQAGLGLVMGATALEELEAALWIFYDSGKKTPFLVPGVGAQGASAGQTASVLRSIWRESLLLHRINSSSAIAYAYKSRQTSDYIGAALEEIKRMNSQIGKID
ncbi:MAG: orotidine-5'-phosphate decarboxylase [Candidatus Micrarchaeota archaeon]|nr:orotidine-5'-phosphate decarboxylase [Candidatus Micrarchaeota archaeon]